MASSAGSPTPPPFSKPHRAVPLVGWAGGWRRGEGKGNEVGERRRRYPIIPPSYASVPSAPSISGKGSSDEQEKGIGGNSILLAQARPLAEFQHLPPKAEELQESFVVLFTRTEDEVSRAQMLTVHRDTYLALIRLRKQVCQTYQEVSLDEARVAAFPEHGVPAEITRCAQHLPEAEKVSITQVGPASRKVDLTCDAHGAEQPDAAADGDAVDWEPLDTKGPEACKPTEAEQERQAFETNTAEDVIAVDHSNDPGLLETFAAFQTKLHAVQEAAARVVAVEHRRVSETSGVAEPASSASLSAPASDAAMSAACATAAAKEECRVIVLETQELARKLTKSDLKKMADTFAQQEQACISTSGSPLSMFAPETWSKCFLDFFYGDAVPNMPQRGLKGNHTTYVPMEDIFAWLQDREELEYTLPAERRAGQPAPPYKARAHSRFDTPELTAIFGSVFRHMLILRGVGATFRRQGYEADLKQIANAKASDCVEALCRGKDSAAKPAPEEGANAAKPARQRGLDQLAYAPDVPPTLQRALRQVLFSQVNVPFTDGYRRKLRHEGHNLNAVHGPLKLFLTVNFSDVYSPILLSMLLQDSDGNPVAPPVEVPRPAALQGMCTLQNPAVLQNLPHLTDQCPELCTLQEMHRRVAQCPRTQAKYWLLMDDLVDRHLLGIGLYYVGNHRSSRLINYELLEDDCCSSGDYGLAGFAVDEEEPLEAQARGFTHGHRKVYGIPEALGPEVLQQFRALSAAQPEAPEPATTASPLATFLAKATKALIDCATTLQYEASTLTAKQLQQSVPAERFTERQQELSRLDGGQEIDGSARHLLAPTPDEPLGHIVAEEHRAMLAGRPVRNAYREVPLTGCQMSLLPHYRQPQVAFQDFPLLDEFGRHDAPELGSVAQPGEGLLSGLPWQLGDDGEVTQPITPNGPENTMEDLKRDSQRWALCFARDMRALHGHNHDHNCSFTCVKYVKQAAKKLASNSAAAAARTAEAFTNIVCRFYFYATIIFNVVEDGVEKVKKVRRRGKLLVATPFVASTNEHNELGRAQVERHTPFRSSTTDVGQCATRCNFDFQFMPRAPVLASSKEDDPASAAPPGASAAEPSAVPPGKKALTYDKAEAFYGIRLQLPGNVAMRQAARSMLAMWQAAHNTDYYITKYGTKALEQLQNLIAQFALGLRRLELEEAQEDEAALHNPQDYKRRARRVTLRLAMAANRATWASCCEMALFIRTRAHVRKTYFPRDIYLSRIAFLCHSCQRLLRHEADFLLEASEHVREGTTRVSTLSFESKRPDDAGSVLTPRPLKRMRVPAPPATPPAAADTVPHSPAAPPHGDRKQKTAHICHPPPLCTHQPIHAIHFPVIFPIPPAPTQFYVLFCAGGA